MAHSISDEVSNVLRSAVCAGNTLTLSGPLDRKMYVAVNKVLELSGFKWNKTSKCHIAINGSASATLSTALDDKKIVDPKKEWDFFQTPEDLANEMAKLADVQPNDRVLEPSAGGGRLCRAVLKRGVPHGQIFVCEAQIDLWSKLAADGFNTLLMRDFTKVSCIEDETLKFDKILANPPFSNGADVIHCRKMYDFLKLDGRMVCITGPGWKYRDTKPYSTFRAWFDSLPSTTVMELPSGTFKDSGTNVRALLLTIDKE